jgi:hypothetical protein
VCFSLTAQRDDATALLRVFHDEHHLGADINTQITPAG